MDTSEIWAERAHWVGEKKTGQERQIVVQFNSYKNKLFWEIARNWKVLTFQSLRTLAKKPLELEKKNGKKY